MRGCGLGGGNSLVACCPHLAHTHSPFAHTPPHSLRCSPRTRLRRNNNKSFLKDQTKTIATHTKRKRGPNAHAYRTSVLTDRDRLEYKKPSSAYSMCKSVTFPGMGSHLRRNTHKWNKIEHRMFCHISQNWRGRPLVSLEAIVELIGNTRTKPGLTIEAALDPACYQKGIAVSDEEMAQLNIRREDFHGEWNYSIAPRAPTPAT
jgi:hypothetical protein